MGAEGGIFIYKDEDVQKYPGSGEVYEMLEYIPRHYSYTLDGRKYHVFYYGDNMLNYDPFDLYHLDYEHAERRGVPRDEFKRFLNWLRSECPRIDWEVWT